jgi:hypothetical protein
MRTIERNRLSAGRGGSSLRPVMCEVKPAKEPLTLTGERFMVPTHLN